MSLVSQLYQGPLGQWCRENLPGTAEVAEQVAGAVAGVDPIRPVGRVERQHWADVGGAVGQRLAFAVEATPPMYALFGAISAGLLSFRGANSVALTWPTHAALAGTDRAGRGLWWRTSPHGGYLTHPHADVGHTDPTVPADEPVVRDFLGRCEQYLRRYAPPGRLGIHDGEEAGIARCCWPLTQWENIYRGGDPDSVQSPGSAEQLHTQCPTEVVEELAALAMLAGRSAAWRRWQDCGDMLPQPGGALGFASPSIVPQWAEADLIVGHCLVDVKTSVRTQPAQVAPWLWQILGYAWLDHADRWKITELSLYLARHGVEVRWPVWDLARQLARTEHTDDLRREFVELAQAEAYGEGVDPEWFAGDLG